MRVAHSSRIRMNLGIEGLLRLVEEIKYITIFWVYGLQSELSDRIYIGKLIHC